MNKKLAVVIAVLSLGAVIAGGVFVKGLLDKNKQITVIKEDIDNQLNQLEKEQSNLKDTISEILEETDTKEVELEEVQSGIEQTEEETNELQQEADTLQQEADELQAQLDGDE